MNIREDHTQTWATSGQTPISQHVRNIHEQTNQVEIAAQTCEIELNAASVIGLIAAANILSITVKKILSEMDTSEEITIEPLHTDIDQEPETKISADALIGIETSKIIALADVLKTVSQYGHNLFEGTAETLLRSIIDHAEAIDAAAKKIG